MITKQNFILLKDVPNVLAMSSSDLDKVKISNGLEKMRLMLDFSREGIDHFSKDKVFNLLEESKKKNKLHIVYLPTYNLPVAYNKSTGGIVINLFPFGVKDILPTRPGVKNLYAAILYGICLSEIATKTVKIDSKYASIISSFFTSIFIRLFGKEYGLLGSFMSEISKLKFLVNCYVNDAFFGESGRSVFSSSISYSGFNYKEIADELDKYDFSDIGNLIQVLSDLKVMPGLNKHLFTAKILKSYTFNFLPAIEDLSRFLATLACSQIVGSTIAPTFLYRVNEDAFGKIIDIVRLMFRK
jgi:hypothetical protein